MSRHERLCSYLQAPGYHSVRRSVQDVCHFGTARGPRTAPSRSSAAPLPAPTATSRRHHAERKSLFTSTRAVPGKWTGALQAEPVLRITRDRRGGSSALYDQDSYLVKAKLDRLIDAPNPGRRLAGRYRRVPPGREMRSDEALRSV